MSTLDQPQLAQPIESLLNRLRRRIRAYVWVEGIAAVLIVLGLSFWASLAFDWVFEPPAPLRVGILLAVAVLLAVVVYRLILRRAFVRLADRSMAMVLERRFSHFHDSLLTAVEMAELPSHAAEFNPEMLASTRSDALAATGNVALSDVFNTAPLLRKIALAAVLLASIAAFGALSADALGIWARRSLAFSAELWPRKTHLSVEGFDERGHAKIARGADFELVVKADAHPGSVVPQNVEVRHKTSDGAKGRENMTRQGEAVSGRDPFQLFHFTFKGELAARELYVYGGDDRGPFFLEVVDSPTVSQMALHCEYPEYMHRTPREIPVSGLVQLPRGTKATIQAQSNKDLRQVQIDDLTDEKSPQTHKLDVAKQGQSGVRTFRFPMPAIEADKTLVFTLLDTDGIRSRDPIRLALAASPDEPPQVNVELKGIGTAITPAARLPAAGEVSDDYGVANLRFEFRIDEQESRQQPLAIAPKGQDKLSVDETLEVEPLKLVPKQKFHLVLQAVDTYALADEPNVGLSQRYVLDVVTPEQLRAMLEARELMLRRRFETIIQEMTDTRDSLARLNFGVPKIPAKPSSGVDSKTAVAAPSKTDRGAEPGDEPGDSQSKKTPEALSAERLLAQRLVQAERVLQNSQRSANETLNLAGAFDDIRAELVNNRVDTEELKSRLKEGIADPLRRIGEVMFPELESRLKAVQAKIADPAVGPQAQSAALAEADAILVSMKQVLDKMLELETFNEVLDRLRTIIALQEKINDQTKEKKKQEDLKDLLK